MQQYTRCCSYTFKHLILFCFKKHAQHILAPKTRACVTTHYEETTCIFRMLKEYGSTRFKAQRLIPFSINLACSDCFQVFTKLCLSMILRPLQESVSLATESPVYRPGYEKPRPACASHALPRSVTFLMVSRRDQ